VRSTCEVEMVTDRSPVVGRIGWSSQPYKQAAAFSSFFRKSLQFSFLIQKHEL
jgi:hypothetical protein